LIDPKSNFGGESSGNGGGAVLAGDCGRELGAAVEFDPRLTGGGKMGAVISEEEC